MLVGAPPASCALQRRPAGRRRADAARADGPAAAGRDDRAIAAADRRRRSAADGSRCGVRRPMPRPLAPHRCRRSARAGADLICGSRTAALDRGRRSACGACGGCHRRRRAAAAIPDLASPGSGARRSTGCRGNWWTQRPEAQQPRKRTLRAARASSVILLETTRAAKLRGSGESALAISTRCVAALQRLSMQPREALIAGLSIAAATWSSAELLNYALPGRAGRGVAALTQELADIAEPAPGRGARSAAEIATARRIACAASAKASSGCVGLNGQPAAHRRRKTAAASRTSEARTRTGPAGRRSAANCWRALRGTHAAGAEARRRKTGRTATAPVVAPLGTALDPRCGFPRKRRWLVIRRSGPLAVGFGADRRRPARPARASSAKPGPAPRWWRPLTAAVVFAGPFRGYGRILIIEHSDGYHSLLAGLGRDRRPVVGQWVLAGEPVGAMAHWTEQPALALRRTAAQRTADRPSALARHVAAMIANARWSERSA